MCLTFLGVFNLIMLGGFDQNAMSNIFLDICFMRSTCPPWEVDGLPNFDAFQHFWPTKTENKYTSTPMIYDLLNSTQKMQSNFWAWPLGTHLRITVNILLQICCTEVTSHDSTCQYKTAFSNSASFLKFITNYFCLTLFNMGRGIYAPLKSIRAVWPWRGQNWDPILSDFS